MLEDHSTSFSIVRALHYVERSVMVVWHLDATHTPNERKSDVDTAIDISKISSLINAIMKRTLIHVAEETSLAVFHPKASSESMGVSRRAIVSSSLRSRGS